MKRLGIGERGSLSIQAIGLLAAAVAVVLGSWVYVETQGRGPIGRIMAAYLQKQTDCWDPDKPCDWEVAYPEGKIDLAAGSGLGEALADPEFEPDLFGDPARLSTSDSGEAAPKGLWEAISEWLRQQGEGVGEGAGEIEAILRELLGDRGFASLLALVGGLSVFLLLRLLLGPALAGLRLLTPGLGLVASLLAGWLSGQAGWGSVALGVLVYLVAVGAVDGVGRLALAAGTRRRKAPGMAAEIPEVGGKEDGEEDSGWSIWDLLFVVGSALALAEPGPFGEFAMASRLAARGPAILRGAQAAVRGVGVFATAVLVALTAGSSGAASDLTTSYVPAFEVNRSGQDRASQIGGSEAGSIVEIELNLLGGEPAVTPPDPNRPDDPWGTEYLPPAGGAAQLLPPKVAESFVGHVERVVLREAITVYRYYGARSPIRGPWLITENTYSRLVQSGHSARQVLRLPSTNAGLGPARWTIPADTEIFIGQIRGGARWALQIWVRDANALIPL